MIFKVLKQVHPECTIRADASFAIQAILHDIIAVVGMRLGAQGTAVNSAAFMPILHEMISGELAKHAGLEATKVLTKKEASTSGSLEERYGLQAPAEAIAGALMAFSNAATPLDVGVSVQVAAVVEYMAAEMLELAGNASKDSSKTGIGIDAVEAAINGDEELLRFSLSLPGEMRAAVLALGEASTAKASAAASERASSPSPGAEATTLTSCPTRDVSSGDAEMATRLNRLSTKQMARIADFM